MILERKQERKSKCLWLKSGKNRKDLFSRRMWRELELEDRSGVYEFHMMNRNVSLSCRILRGHTFWKMILNCNVDPQCSTAILNLSFFQRGLYCWAAAPRNSFQVSRHLKLALAWRAVDASTYPVSYKLFLIYLLLVMKTDFEVICIHVLYKIF